MKRIAVLTSGGDAPGMNAAVRAVVRSGIDHDMEVYAVHNGYEGLIDGKFERMSRRSVADILHRGGTIIKTARSKRFQTPEGRLKAYENMKKLKIEALIVIGGNGSLTGAQLLSEETDMIVMGIPGTIDNDLAYTDFTIGFDTAVNTVLDAISRIRDTSSSHDRSTIIEVMGRNCGEIALYAGITGGAEIVLIPEIDTPIEDVIIKFKGGINAGKLHNIVIRAEGYYMSSQEVADIISKETGLDVKLVVLSYLQRGGAPTFRDRLLATECGMLAVELLDQGIGNRAIGEVNGEIVHMDIGKALQAKRTLNEDFIRHIDILSR